MYSSVWPYDRFIILVNRLSPIIKSSRKLMRYIFLVLLGFSGIVIILPASVTSWATSDTNPMECESEVLYVVEERFTLRPRPSLFVSSESLDLGTPVCVVASRRGFFILWYRVVTQHGGEGWIDATKLGTFQEYLDLQPISTPETTLQAISTAALEAEVEEQDENSTQDCTDAWGTSSIGYRIRSGPGTSYGSTGQHIVLGEQVCVLAETGNWAYIRKSDGTVGYTHIDGITYQSPAVLTPAASPIPLDRDLPILSSETSRYRTLLSALSVAPHSHLYTYDRDDWGGNWTDADQDCQNTRHEVLQLESQRPVTFSRTRRCYVDTGLWTGPWSGETFTRASALDIDHHVPLKNAHISGGALWSREKKVAYYNDMELEAALQAMKNSLNRTKGASGPEEWKPPVQDTWCQYARDWIEVKTKYSLSVTSAEKTALTVMLDTCDATEAGTPTVRKPETTPTQIPLSVSTATPVPLSVLGVSLTSCQVHAEMVTFTNSSTKSLDLSGYVIHDDGSKHVYTFPAGSIIAPGVTWTLISGPEAEANASQNVILFARRHIWNNSGDIAYLKQGNTVVDSLVCQ